MAAQRISLESKGPTDHDNRRSNCSENARPLLPRPAPLPFSLSSESLTVRMILALRSASRSSFQKIAQGRSVTPQGFVNIASEKTNDQQKMGDLKGVFSQQPVLVLRGKCNPPSNLALNALTQISQWSGSSKRAG